VVGGLPALPVYAPAFPPAARPQPQPAPRPPARPVVRGQKPDESPRAPAELPPLVMPTPQELGIPVPRVTAKPVDWSDVRARLDQLGATGFALEKAGAGYRFTCQLPAGRLVEGRGATEAEAVRLGLEQAEGRPGGR
jgi:hypothetical protein